MLGRRVTCKAEHSILCNPPCGFQQQKKAKANAVSFRLEEKNMVKTALTLSLGSNRGIITK